STHSYNSLHLILTPTYLHCFNPNFYCLLASNSHACISPHLLHLHCIYTLLQLITSHTHTYLHCFNPNFYCLLASNSHACISPTLVALTLHLHTLTTHY